MSTTSSAISSLTAGARRSAGSTDLNGTASTGWCALPTCATMMMEAFRTTHGAMSMTSSTGASARPTRKPVNPSCSSGRTTGWSPSVTKRTRILLPASCLTGTRKPPTLTAPAIGTSRAAASALWLSLNDAASAEPSATTSTTISVYRRSC